VSVITEAAALPPLFDPTRLAGFTAEQQADAAAAASATVRNYCRWHIAPSITDVLTLDGTGAMVLPLPSLHVTDVAEVTEVGTVITDYEWSARGLLRRSGGLWPACWRSVVVTLTHGYEDIPEDVAVVAYAVARQSLTNPAGIRQETIRSYSVTYSGAGVGESAGLGSPVGAAGAVLLDRYRIPNAP
jgi:hypothetical protein